MKIRAIYAAAAIVLTLGTISLNAKTFEYWQIHNMPKSIEKDYYIWRFLSQSTTTASEAKSIIQEASFLNKKLREVYRRKTGLAPHVQAASAPVRRKATEAEKQQWKANHQKLQALKQGKLIAPAWVASTPQMECYLFNNCGHTIRKQRFDKLLSSKEYRLMTMDEKFDQSIRIILSEDLPKLRQSLMQPPAEGNLISPQTHFKLGLYALSQNKPKIALLYFGQARKKFTERKDKDKANFWLYLVSKDKGYLKNLLNSYHVNMYTLAARDIMKMKYPKTITPKLSPARIGHFNIQDPIHWAALKEKLFSGRYNLQHLADEYKSDETIGPYTYIKAKASNFKESYFPMPYRNIMKNLSPKRQALLYAIARQESRFVPASVSRSFALGMMQIMPFLVEDIAMKKGEKIDLDEMFNPYKALDYANFHLDYLTTYLYHPLFVAYAYNGGIGFTRNLITTQKYFRPGAYQPYWSMETIQNEEAKEYGKHVLTNYVIYMNKLGQPTRLLPFLESLTTPPKTDKFRQ